jgi:peptidoglycan/xylan/chitin deacetylase (PgdA/CDA1 family)
MKKFICLTLGMVYLLTACIGTSATETSLAPTETPPPPTVTATFTAIPAATQTLPPSPIPTATWIKQGPGNVTVPILLYHRIDVSSTDSRYYVPPEKFEEQMGLLHNWGYSSITPKTLIEAITEGAKLPPRPFLITFDDGHLDNYSTAFPIMQKYGYTGALYLVVNYIGADGYMDVDQILEMYDAGWEMGSHSTNHFDLTNLDQQMLRAEVVGSRKSLEKMLGIPIETFAYPFGIQNSSAIDYVRFAGYTGAMGASGYTSAQGKWNLYYLQRVEIKGTEDAKTFTRFLPWQGDPEFLPTDTPVP